MGEVKVGKFEGANIQRVDNGYIVQGMFDSAIDCEQVVFTDPHDVVARVARWLGVNPQEV